MSSVTKADKKAVHDVAAWMFNVVTSVGIILVNKALMSAYGFRFGMFLDRQNYMFNRASYNCIKSVW